MSDKKLRSNLIRVASELPKGSDERKKVLALIKESMEHDSPEALKKYLKDHPDADKSKHTVKKDDGGEKKDDGGGEKKEISKEQAAAAKGLKDTMSSGAAKRIKPEIREKLTKGIEQMEKTGTPPDDLRKTFREALDSLLPGRKIPAVKEVMTALKSQFKALDVPKSDAPKKPDISKYKGQRGVIAPPSSGGVGKPYRRRASGLRKDALRIASTLPKGDPTRKKLLAALQGKTAGRLDRVDSFDLLQFAQAYCDLGGAVQSQFVDLMTLDEDNWAGMNPNAVEMMKRKRLHKFHEDIEDAINSYEDWLENDGR